MTRYRGVAQVEYEYVREHVYESFACTTFAEASPGRKLALSAPARVALVATACVHLPDQSAFACGR